MSGNERLRIACLAQGSRPISDRLEEVATVEKKVSKKRGLSPFYP